MNDGYRRRVEPTEIVQILAGCGIGADEVTEIAELSEGTFNTAYRVRRSSGADLVLKIAPRPGTPILGYERDLMHAEVEFYREAALIGSVPTPVVAYADFSRTVTDSDVLLMSECPGESWQSRRDQLGRTDQLRLRADLGRFVAALHQITGTGFGYRRGPRSPLARSWRDAVEGMFGALLVDAERFGVRLPVPTGELADLVSAQAGLLDEVTTPALVHFDLWNGNILVAEVDGRPEIGGLIDGERAFWGDPVADFASLALFGDIEADESFLMGYREAGGVVVFDDRTRRRLALYRCYLYLIMMVESAPRGYEAAERAWLVQNVEPCLRAELGTLTGRQR
ncbi:MAG TPA: aminoglycoside phosphotransferase family protein [Pseudonocardiaceae bacterium]|nr:aminoglycoside phosphotransferase family protein [Pseudonocardiaceae bacterium]